MASAGRIVINLSAGTAQFLLDLERANAKLKDLGATTSGMRGGLRDAGAAADNAGKSFADMGTHGVTGVQATSGALRVLEGSLNNNMRAAERFVANVLGLGPALQAIFPLVGGIAMIGIFEHLVEEVQRAYEALKRMEAAPARIADEFRKLNGATAAANDELRVTNDRLSNEIAKLEGKPQNELKLALDEAAVSADKLARALRGDFEELSKIFEKENIGFLKGEWYGVSPTSNIKDAFIGKNGFGGFQSEIQTEGDQLSDKLADLRKQQASGQITPKAAADQAEIARAQERNSLEAIYGREVAFTNEDLRKRRAAQALSVEYGNLNEKIYNHTATDQDRARFQELRLTQVPLIGDQSAAISIDERLKVDARQRLDEINLTTANEGLEKKKGSLEAARDQEGLTRPFENRLKQLDAQIEGVQTKLAAVGESQGAKVLAASWEEALRQIEEVNKALGKHHAALTLDQQVEILTRTDTLKAVEAELQWKDRLEQSTATILERIQVQRMLSEAVGKGYTAQRSAVVEGQVMQAVGRENYNDPAWMRAHQPDVTQERQRLTTEYDEKQKTGGAETNDKLSDQISLERSLASAQTEGADAVRLITLAYKLREIALTGSHVDGNLTTETRNHMQAVVELDQAERQNQSATNLAKIQEEIGATQRLTAAEVDGAEAVRKAQLENKYEQMQRAGATPQEIQAQRGADEAQNQKDVLDAALKTGIEYKNQLEAIGKQISTLEQLKTTHGDTLAIEIALHDLEVKRAQVWAQQVEVIGSARDGLRAYFQEMATSGESAAKQVHDTLKSTFDSLNESLAKLMAGQKVNWGSFFSGISADLAKMTLKNVEANVAAKWFPQGQPAQKGEEGTTPQGVFARLAGLLSPPRHQRTATPAANSQTAGGAQTSNIPGLPGSKTTLGRDGQSAASAFFVTEVSQSANPSPLSGDKSAASSALSSIPAPSPVPGRAASLHQAFGAVSSPAASLRSALSHAIGAPSIGPRPTILQRQSTGSTSTPVAYPGVGGSLGELPAVLTATDRENLGSTPELDLKALAGLIPNFNGAYADGGSLKKGRTHLVGERGMELFVPKEDGTIVPNHKLSSLADLMAISGGGTRKGLAGAIAKLPHRAEGGDVDADQPYVTGERGPEMYLSGDDRDDNDPLKGIDDTRSNSRWSNLSRPTPTTSFLQDLVKAAGGGASKLGGLFGRGGQQMQVGASGDNGSEGISDQELQEGGIQSADVDDLAGPNPALGSQNVDALGTNALANAIDPNDVIQPSAGFAFGSLASTGIGIGLGILSRLLNRKHDEHRRPGNPFVVPDFNSALADGGRAKRGMSHLVGERGKELFIPDAPGEIIPHHKLGTLGVSHFGGYRASGGPVDPGNAYMVGELGTEAYAYTPGFSGGSSSGTAPMPVTQSGAGGRGDTYIDARNSDPAAVQQRVDRAMKASYHASVRSSFKNYIEYANRSPQTTGGG